MIILDTNVVSELMRNAPDERVAEWVDQYPAHDVFVTAVTAAESAAGHYGQISAARERGGRPISMADAQIAAICRHHNANLATRNTKDVVDTGVRVLNPWDVESQSP